MLRVAVPQFFDLGLCWATLLPQKWGEMLAMGVKRAYGTINAACPRFCRLSPCCHMLPPQNREGQRGFGSPVNKLQTYIYRYLLAIHRRTHFENGLDVDIDLAKSHFTKSHFSKL